MVAPLQVTVRDFVAGIERRQRGLDLQQEEILKRIGAIPLLRPPEARIARPSGLRQIRSCSRIIQCCGAISSPAIAAILQSSHTLPALRHQYGDDGFVQQTTWPLA
ncbi:hypothetical protein WMF18_19670 [Sorangium sp. So ce315]|uniref:hypothetical protein n=1 Tax=Sorangium sp. So ce315 TaxID=3133299 RepID=UPI003F5FA966